VNVKARAQDETNALHFACQKGHTEVARLLINAGIPVNSKTRKGFTPLQLACQHSASLQGLGVALVTPLERSAA